MRTQITINRLLKFAALSLYFVCLWCLYCTNNTLESVLHQSANLILQNLGCPPRSLYHSNSVTLAVTLAVGSASNCCSSSAGCDESTSSHSCRVPPCAVGSSSSGALAMTCSVFACSSVSRYELAERVCKCTAAARGDALKPAMTDQLTFPLLAGCTTSMHGCQSVQCSGTLCMDSSTDSWYAALRL
jgi:hypothetical protein